MQHSTCGKLYICDMLCGPKEWAEAVQYLSCSVVGKLSGPLYKDGSTARQGITRYFLVTQLVAAATLRAAASCQQVFKIIDKVRHALLVDAVVTTVAAGPHVCTGRHFCRWCTVHCHVLLPAFCVLASMSTVLGTTSSSIASITSSLTAVLPVFCS